MRLPLKENTQTYKIYEMISKSPIAFFISEITENLGGDMKTTHALLTLLSKQKLVVRSNFKLKTPKGGKTYIYGRDELSIQKKSRLWKSQEKPEWYIWGKKRNHILSLIKNSPSGLTTKEIAAELDLNPKRVATICQLLWKRRVIERSPFTMPKQVMPLQQFPFYKSGYIWGGSKGAVEKKLIELMPKEVQNAFFLIMRTSEVWNSILLKQKTGITDGDMHSWFDLRLCKTGIIKYIPHKGLCTFYWNAKLDKNFVKSRIVQLQKSIVDFKLGTTTAGRDFEKYAIERIVYYLKARGRRIVVPKDFPKKIPSWFNGDDIEKFTKTTSSGREILCDVWKYDREPIDYLIFERDPLLGIMTTWAISIKYSGSGHKFGAGYVFGMLGAILDGYVLDFIRQEVRIPNHRAIIPMFCANEIWGKRIWELARVKGVKIVTKKTLYEMGEVIKQKLGRRLMDTKKLEYAKIVQKAFKNAKNTRSVILGEKDVWQYMKERGYKIVE